MNKSNKTYRPNFKRQMLYAGVTLGAMLLGYLVVYLYAGMDEKKTEETVETPQAKASTAKPWYQKQSPPPVMITTPDLPLFPEVDDTESDDTGSARAYEEALPKETYEPPVEKITPETPPAPANTLPRWQQYAVASPSIAALKSPLIAIVIDDMGVDMKRSAQAIALKGPLTLSFLTYAAHLDKQTESARSRGHELMLHVAMEPGSKAVDPGPNALMTDLSDEELRRRLEWSFQRFSTYVGVNNHMGSKFTADKEAMRVVIAEIKRRGLLFLDSRTSGRTIGAKLAREMGVPVAERNIFLDHENTVDAVNAQLLQVEKLARRTGLVIAIGHPRDATIKALQPWLEGIEEKGFTLVPLTTIVSMIGLP